MTFCFLCIYLREFLWGWIPRSGLQGICIYLNGPSKLHRDYTIYISPLTVWEYTFSYKPHQHKTSVEMDFSYKTFDSLPSSLGRASDFTDYTVNGAPDLGIHLGGSRCQVTKASWTPNQLTRWAFTLGQAPGTQEVSHGPAQGALRVPTVGEMANTSQLLPAEWIPNVHLSLASTTAEKMWVVVTQPFHLKSFISPLAYE